MITRADLSWWLGLEPQLDWQFATTYAEGAPHEYVAASRTQGLEPADFVRAAHVIQTFGEPMKFYKRTRIYLTTPMGWKHWTMDSDLAVTALINRGSVDHVYGVQNAPRTRSDIDSPFDAFASTWDDHHGLTASEAERTAAFIGEAFGDKLRRTLDVGCGTGWPLTRGLVEQVRYVGIDPSTAMLNTLVARHPVTAGLHPMTWGDAERRRVLCGTRFDTVLALGGSASYLTPDELDDVVARGTRGAVLMHYGDGELPPTGDLDQHSATASLAATTERAVKQERVGRFVLSYVPATR